MKMNDRTRGVLLAVAGLLAACAAPQENAGRDRTDNPTVTYDYVTDIQLLAAREDAVRFCRQYEAFPQVLTTSSNPAAPPALRKIVFECAAMAPAKDGAGGSVPDMTVAYRSDAELLDAAAAAQTHCARQGLRSAASVARHADGPHTATFRCIP